MNFIIQEVIGSYLRPLDLSRAVSALSVPDAILGSNPTSPPCLLLPLAPWNLEVEIYTYETGHLLEHVMHHQQPVMAFMQTDLGVFAEGVHD